MSRRGHRGYIGARMAMGRSVPQSVQQLVLRDYCRKRGLEYLLAATEYCLPGSTAVLDGVLDELDRIAGIVMYSLFLFPERRAKRQEMLRRVLDHGATLHTAVEGIVIAGDEDARRVEDTWLVAGVLGAQHPGLIEDLKTWERVDAGDQLPRRLSAADEA